MTVEALYTLIESPVISEKSTNAEMNNQYSFRVSPKTNKKRVKQAIETIFGVKVVAVRTMTMKGKVKRDRRGLGRRNKWKKAIVTIIEGQRIEYAGSD